MTSGVKGAVITIPPEGTTGAEAYARPMSHKPSLFARIRQFFWLARESYDTRQARGGELDGLAPQQYEATDRRRHGGSGDIGAG